jgi:cysteine synthase
VGASSILSAIGNTPVVEVKSLGTKESRVLAKLEGMNPSGSLKDRCALGLIEEAQRHMSLEGKVLLDSTSGNLGTSVAMIGASLGLKVRLLIPRTVTQEKRRSMELLGAELQPIDGTSLEGARLAADMAAQDSRYLFLDQFHNQANIRVHYETTGSEILRDVPDVAAYVCAVASGGSLMGVAKRLRERASKARVYAVTAANGTRIPGLRNVGEEGTFPPLVDMSMVDDEFRIEMSQALEMVSQTARNDGLLVGLSSGAVLAAAGILARSDKVRGPIVALCGDSSLKYLSGALANL